MEWVINGAERRIPVEIDGVKLLPYRGPFVTPPQRERKYGARLYHLSRPGQQKILRSIEEAVKRVGLTDGMTISFHHHFRNGDRVMNMVLETLERMGFKNLTIAPSSLFPCQEEVLLRCLKNGVVKHIEGGGLRGKIGRYVSEGNLERPVRIRSHGGRVRAIEAGELHIDVAFIGAPTADEMGNLTGVYGPSACGPLSYSMADALYADRVVAITDNLVPFPLDRFSISMEYVDYVVVVDKIGNPEDIVFGSLKVTSSPTRLKIAKDAVRLAYETVYVKEGFTFQAGAGGISLAFVNFLAELMREKGIRARWANGGTTSYLVDMLREDLVEYLTTAQAFDLTAIDSMRVDKNHLEVSIGFYANPHNKGTLVNLLDLAVLGATEVDENFNVNTVTYSSGYLAEPVGGHSDVAAGSKLTIITVPLIRGRFPSVVEEVTTVVTPGETVDAVVTERGIAINPRREDLLERLEGSDLPIRDIEELRREAYSLTGGKKEPPFGENIAALVEYRDGTIIDVVREVKT
ncbi:MAG: citrate lyase subunit alpha [Thermoplasmata archaeon]|nr:citrate lyase subunit alpha [Thermoplasmata archaeon]